MGTIHLLDDARRGRAKRALALVVSEAKRSAYIREHYEGAPDDAEAANVRASEDFALWLMNTQPCVTPLSYEETRAVFAITYVGALGVSLTRQDFVDDCARAFGRVG